MVNLTPTPYFEDAYPTIYAEIPQIIEDKAGVWFGVYLRKTVAAGEEIFC